jgi:hypothetical protein
MRLVHESQRDGKGPAGLDRRPGGDKRGTHLRVSGGKRRSENRDAQRDETVWLHGGKDDVDRARCKRGKKMAAGILRGKLTLGTE